MAPKTRRTSNPVTSTTIHRPAAPAADQAKPPRTSAASGPKIGQPSKNPTPRVRSKHDSLHPVNDPRQPGYDQSSHLRHCYCLCSQCWLPTTPSRRKPTPEELKNNKRLSGAATLHYTGTCICMDCPCRSWRPTSSLSALVTRLPGR